MKRRKFITLLAGAVVASPLAARAQSQPKMLRVGFVGVQPRESPLYAAFLERMTELGYQEGRNFTFDFEYIQTPNIDGYEKGYRELAGRKVDVFLAVGNERALLAARAAAEGGPIAFLAINFDPLAKGYVASLSQPGGNVTGIFVHQLELAAKRVEIAREAFPRANIVGIAFDTVSREQQRLYSLPLGKINNSAQVHLGSIDYVNASAIHTQLDLMGEGSQDAAAGVRFCGDRKLDAPPPAWRFRGYEAPDEVIE
jgi:putative ABC transport system substrate-binding protein